MTNETIETAYVLFLAGRLLTPDVSPPLPATAVWCRSADELAERLPRLRPSCVIIDASGEKLAGLAQALAGHRETLIATVGAPPPGVRADCVLDGSGELAGEIVRVVRFALGQRVRQSVRVAARGVRAVLEPASAPAQSVDVLDVSEHGVRVVPTTDCPSGRVAMRLVLDEQRQYALQAELVRRTVAGGAPSAVFRFVEVPPRARAGLRAYLLRRAAGPPDALVAGRGDASRPRTTSIVGGSPALQRAVDTIDRVAATDVTVLLLGETGTGKEVAARALHERSRRADRPFVAVNCAALPENLVESELFGHEAGAFTGATRRKIGRIEQASSGTLFLDEIGDLPVAAQAKLLRALQERTIERVGGNEPIRVDIRLVAATNQDLESNVASRSFRRDLFFRLNVVTIRLPPLRARGDDIPLLFEHFLRHAQQRLGKRDIRLNEHALSSVQAYPWPGNVRELENVCTRLAALLPSGAVVGPEHLNLFATDELTNSPLPSTDLRDILDFCEREIVRRMLERNGGNRTQTARSLGISRQALQQKLARFRSAVETEPSDDDGTHAA